MCRSNYHYKLRACARRNTLRQNYRCQSQCCATNKQLIGNQQVPFAKISTILRKWLMEYVVTQVLQIYLYMYQSLYNSIESLDKEMAELSENIKSAKKK